MTAPMHDVCTYQGLLYCIMKPALIPGIERPWWRSITSAKTLTDLGITPGLVSTACWHGCVGYFELDDSQKLWLQAVLCFRKGSEIPPPSELWEARVDNFRIWEVGHPSFSPQHLQGKHIEYVLREPQEVPFTTVGLSKRWSTYPPEMEITHDRRSLRESRDP